jgi:hypothetical protein
MLTAGCLQLTGQLCVSVALCQHATVSVPIVNWWRPLGERRTCNNKLDYRSHKAGVIELVLQVRTQRSLDDALVLCCCHNMWRARIVTYTCTSGTEAKILHNVYSDTVLDTEVSRSCSALHQSSHSSGFPYRRHTRVGANKTLSLFLQRHRHQLLLKTAGQRCPLS